MVKNQKSKGRSSTLRAGLRGRVFLGREVKTDLSAVVSQLELPEPGFSDEIQRYPYTPFTATTVAPRYYKLLDYAVINLKPEYILGIAMMANMPRCGRLLALTVVYGRYEWALNRAPKRVIHPLMGPYLVSHPAPVHVQRERAATLLRVLRQLFGAYSRYSGIPWVPGCKAREAIQRMTEEPDIDLPRTFSSVGWHLFKRFSLSWLGDADSDEFENYCHGPGAVAEGFTQEAKELVNYQWDEHLTDSLDLRPFRPLFYDIEWSRLGALHVVPVATASRVLEVPKDFRGPRVIAATPALRQYVQQACLHSMFSFTKRSRVLRRVVEFVDQGRNARSALRGSADSSIDTLDLSDASDHIRLAHVRALLADLPDLLSWFELVRVGRVQYDGVETAITTFAPMGEPCCFPMLAWVIASLAIAWRCDQRTRGTAATWQMINSSIDELKLCVYGDDIVISHQFGETFVGVLERAGLKPNPAKCCMHTRFREACGTDAWMGHDVTPLRPRHWPGDAGCTLTGLYDLIEQLASRQMFATARRLYELACYVVQGRIPVVPTACRGAGVIASDELYDRCDLPYRKAHWSKRLYLWVIPTFCEKPRFDGRDRMRRALRDALSSGRPDQAFVGYPSPHSSDITSVRALSYARPMVW